MQSELQRHLKEIGIMPELVVYREPTPEQTKAKDFYNTLNLTKEEDGSWTPNF